MPKLVRGRWYPNDGARADVAFHWGTYDDGVRSLYSLAYEQFLLNRIWLPRAVMSLRLSLAGVESVDEYIELFTSLNGWLSQKLEIGGVEVDGYVFSTDVAVDYFTYRANGGNDNPSNYLRDSDGIWRRGA